ncbi:MAG: PD-(D/E)XK nuclease family protein [Planctomycetes bacterium]|nr:PD-(D/E)XK nuclease family protein [Planctomycetota bacterium]
MAVRFVLGRAGTGKTFHCLEAVRRRLREDPLGGPSLILLVPEQAGLQVERAVLDPQTIAVAHRAVVLSFRRLAYKVFETAGAPPRRALSESARVMVLRHLLRRRAGELRFYRRVDRVAGFLERLAAAVAELIEEAVSPDELVAACGAAPADDAPAESAKLHDLHLIYTAYLEYLGNERLDPSQFLQAARERLDRCPWLPGAEVWVDGFASLSGQEALTLVALARQAAAVDITVLVDPALAEGAAQRASPGAQRLFAKTLRTYRELHRTFAEAGVAVDEPLLLTLATPPRFQSSAELARLERGLFEPAAPPADHSAAPRDIELVELPSRRIEVEYAVSRIMRWVQAPSAPLRYRDIAVIVRDLEPYHDLLAAALSARAIPYFIDRRRPVTHHPLVELLRCGAAMALEDLSQASVRMALKTGLLPLPDEAADELENYVLAHGVAGLAAWSGSDWSHWLRASLVRDEEGPAAHERKSLERVNAGRRKVVDCLSDWLHFARAPEGHTGPEWTSGLHAWLERLSVAATMEHWCDEADAAGDPDQAAEHRQIWREVSALLDDLAFAFASEAMAVEDFARVLEQGLSTLTLGLAPPMIDQVLVGSIERSRHPDIKAAVVVGFNDGVFPQAAAEDAILNDDDRAALRDRGVRIGPPAQERVLDEALLVYIALTRPCRHVVVTWAAADNDGEALRTSPYAPALFQVFSALSPKRTADPLRARAAWDIHSRRDLACRLVTEFRARPPMQRDDAAMRGRWNGLYAVARQDEWGDETLRRAFSSLSERNQASLTADSVQRLFAGPLRASVSQLEAYATCPFKHFAVHSLRLRERAESTLAPVDIGQVHHAVLEDLLGQLTARGTGFAALSEEQLLTALQESFARVAAAAAGRAPLSGARDAYLLRRSLAHLSRVVRAQRRTAQPGKALPQAAELPFGFDQPGSLPPLQLSTPGGRRVLLRGYIDRVDIAELADELLGVVVDYKRTREKKLELDQVFHGVSLQLLGYLLVLAEHGQSLTGRPVRPIAGLYVSLAPRYESVAHPTRADDSRAAETPGTYRPRGILLADDFPALDACNTGEWSRTYSYFRTKEGDAGRIDQSDSADRRSFQALLDHTRQTLGRLADGILEGRIDVSPYRLGTFSPCAWCAMSAFCRFEMDLSDVRFLNRMKRSEVLAQLNPPE